MSERRGYTMGRLLAALDHLGVVPDVERLYVLASSDPSYLTAPLQRATAVIDALERCWAMTEPADMGDQPHQTEPLT